MRREQYMFGLATCWSSQCQAMVLLESSKQFTTTLARHCTRQKFAWCCAGEMIAQRPDENEPPIRIHRIAGYDKEATQARLQQQLQKQGETFHSDTLDLTDSSGFMEFVEGWNTNNGTTNVKYTSAYDTLRCDLLLKRNNNKSLNEHTDEKWKIWGLDYHLERIQRSFRELVSINQSNQSIKYTTPSPQDIDNAVEHSRLLFKDLLQEASLSQRLQKHEIPSTESCQDNNKQNVLETVQDPTVWIQLVRFTWVWTQISDPPYIRVMAHACSSAKPANVFQIAKPAVVTIAAILEENGKVQVDSSLPSRHSNHPHVKLTQWTRQRQLLQKDLSRYNDASIANDEVLLVRSAGVDEQGADEQGVELLEGLTSNVFVIYKDGSLGTASTEDVLPGYARHLVLELYSNTTTNPRVRPILLTEIDQWQEVFITSSSRLILPVEKIMIPRRSADGQVHWVKFWSTTASKASKQRLAPSPTSISKAVEMQRGLLKLAGY